MSYKPVVYCMKRQMEANSNNETYLRGGQAGDYFVYVGDPRSHRCRPLDWRRVSIYIYGWCSTGSKYISDVVLWSCGCLPGKIVVANFWLGWGDWALVSRWEAEEAQGVEVRSEVGRLLYNYAHACEVKDERLWRRSRSAPVLANKKPHTGLSDEAISSPLRNLNFHNPPRWPPVTLQLRP